MVPKVSSKCYVTEGDPGQTHSSASVSGVFSPSDGVSPYIASGVKFPVVTTRDISFPIPLNPVVTTVSPIFGIELAPFGVSLSSVRA